MDEQPDVRPYLAAVVVGIELPGDSLDAKIRELEAREPQLEHSIEIAYDKLETQPPQILFGPAITYLAFEAANYYLSTIEMLREAASSSLPALAAAIGTASVCMAVIRTVDLFKEIRHCSDQLSDLKNLKELKVLRNHFDHIQRRVYRTGAAYFASYVTDKYPQTDRDGRLNYYISGSLAVMLLSSADSMELLDHSQLPRVSVGKKQQVPHGLIDKLDNFARKIGDLDFVRTKIYDEALDEANRHYPSDPEKYQILRSKILTKGGGGPSIDELPDFARDILEIHEGTIKVMCDPGSTLGEDQVARVTVRDRKYFISDPRQMFGYKVLHLMQGFSAKPERFKRDFTILGDALSELYTLEELIKSAYSVLVAYEDSMAKFGPQASKHMRKLDDNPEFDSTIRPFFDRLREHDSAHRNLMQAGG